MSNFKSLQPDYIQLFQLGEEQAFNHYFKTWYKQFCFFAFKYIKDQAAAEDIVSDCFLKVWNKKEGFTNESMLKSYFYVSIANACKRWLVNKQREEKNLYQLKAQAELSIRSHIHNIICTETIKLLHEAIDTLPERCKQVFIKMYIEERTTKEIAAEMNTTVSTIKNQKLRGLKLLKPKLSNQS